MTCSDESFNLDTPIRHMGKDDKLEKWTNQNSGTYKRIQDEMNDQLSLQIDLQHWTTSQDHSNLQGLSGKLGRPFPFKPEAAQSSAAHDASDLARMSQSIAKPDPLR